MNQVIKIGSLTIDCFVNEYDKATKKQKQIPCKEISKQDRAAIDRGLDDTDFGEFFRFENKDKIITGMFNVIMAEEQDE